mgnify:CR=1 FL=1
MSNPKHYEKQLLGSESGNYDYSARPELVFDWKGVVSILQQSFPCGFVQYKMPLGRKVAG